MRKLILPSALALLACNAFAGSELIKPLPTIGAIATCNSCTSDAQFENSVRNHFREHYEMLGDYQERPYFAVNENTGEAIRYNVTYWEEYDPEINRNLSYWGMNKVAPSDGLANYRSDVYILLNTIAPMDESGKRQTKPVEVNSTISLGQFEQGGLDRHMHNIWNSYMNNQVIEMSTNDGRFISRATSDFMLLKVILTDGNSFLAFVKFKSDNNYPEAYYLDNTLADSNGNLIDDSHINPDTTNTATYSPGGGDGERKYTVGGGSKKSYHYFCTVTQGGELCILVPN